MVAPRRDPIMSSMRVRRAHAGGCAAALVWLGLGPRVTIALEKKRPMRTSDRCAIALPTAVVFVLAARGLADAQQPKKPNILVIVGDDIGIPQISASIMGLMGYRSIWLLVP